MSAPPGGRWRRGVGIAVAVLLTAGVLALAGPSRVAELLARSDPKGVLLAAVAAGGALVCRGLRLTVLVGSGLPAARAVALATAAQSAAVFVPARIGELAMPWLLRRHQNLDMAAGVGVLVVSRALDVAALGVWAAGGIVAVWGTSNPLALAVAFALVAPLLLLPFAAATVERLAVRLLARRLAGRRWAHRVRRLRRSLGDLRRSPGRLLTAATVSLATWAMLWVKTWLLLVAMGYRWPFADVLVGAAVASLTNAVPLHVVGNLGASETGWTAAFVALGVPLAAAAATGLAVHLWSLLYSAVFGAVAWLALPGSPATLPDHRE